MRPEHQFVKRMTALFGTPDVADPDDVVNEYANALAGQSEATLNRAADHLARTHKFRNWPTVAECLDAVALAKRPVNTSAMGLERIDDVEGWFSERLARIRIATTERQIDAELRQIEPYDLARWIGKERFPAALHEADGRRRQLQVEQSGNLARRKTGEAA